MEVIPVTRFYLESLTTAELVKMADNLGIEMPPDLDRIFIIDELMEADNSDVVDFSDFQDVAFGGETPVLDQDEEIPVHYSAEPVPLPKQYNITFIEVMIRDPLWAFVFWEVKAQDKDQFEKSPDFNGYYLKLSNIEDQKSLSGNTQAIASGDFSQRSFKEDENSPFTIPVKPDDNAWYLGLSSVIESGNLSESQAKFKVEICVNLKGEETVIAVSNPFMLPKLPESVTPFREGKQKPVTDNTLVDLSGYADFHILRKNERQLREKRSTSKVSHE